ncbi:MAG: hypothetical protein EXR62_06420 [Chloroflexi bacterium]|nr:hypothetical protein [Chloroflexota bacterium]
MFHKSRDKDEMVESWRQDDLGRRIRQDLQASYGTARPSDQVWQRVRQNLPAATAGSGPNLIVRLVHRALFTSMGPVVLLVGIMMIAGLGYYSTTTPIFSRVPLPQNEAQYPQPVSAAYEIWLDKSLDKEGASVHRIVTYEQWEGPTVPVSSDSPSYRERLAWGR